MDTAFVAYEQTIVTAIAFMTVPAIALSFMLRPRPFWQVLRGGEAAVCLALAIDGSRRLGLIALGLPVSYPGDVWAIVNLTLLGIVSLLLWARVAQLVRHSARNRDARERWAQYLGEQEEGDDANRDSRR